jgi:hypothetical protein
MNIAHVHNIITVIKIVVYKNQNIRIMKFGIRLASVEYHCYYCSHHLVTQGITGQYEEHLYHVNTKQQSQKKKTKK